MPAGPRRSATVDGRWQLPHGGLERGEPEREPEELRDEEDQAGSARALAE